MRLNNIIQTKVLALVLTIAALTAGHTTARAQESLQRQMKGTQEQKTFTTVKELPITSTAFFFLMCVCRMVRSQGALSGAWCCHIQNSPALGYTHSHFHSIP